MTTTSGPPTTAEVRRISALANPVIRNLEITACYAELAVATGVRTQPYANWCTFATWASKQAGATIRGEDLLDGLERELGRRAGVLRPLDALWRRMLRRGLLQPQTRLGRRLMELDTPFDAFERASEAVAVGNRKVFDEIALHFARYVHEVDPAAPADGPEMQRFLEGLSDGDPPDGQRYLRRAFVRYQQQTAEPDPGRRAALVALANLEIGLHEQTRLQPQIRAAMDAAISPEDLVGRLLGRIAQRRLTAISREAITHSFMVLALPDGALELGRNLDVPIPEALRTPAEPELVELLARYEPEPPDPDDCGARDWSEIDQRMHYISHLFRAYGERPELATPPFTAEQIARFRAGVVPDGRL